MKQKKPKFGKLPLIVLLISLIGISLYSGWYLFNKFVNDGYVAWNFDGENWKASWTAPECEDPLTIGAPMDLNRATSKLYPGQVRGTDFKPHGGLADDDATGTKMDIYLVRDAHILKGSRYIENGVVQYLIDFVDSCGVMIRYDHIATLSSELTNFGNKLPEPKENDSRTHDFLTHPLFKKGTIIATAVGKEGNVGFDLGVYDLRKRNEASKTDLYKTDEKRISDKEQSFFSVCWFDLLVGKDKDIVKALPSRSGAEGTSSDYCQIS